MLYTDPQASMHKTTTTKNMGIRFNQNTGNEEKK